jgi:hypothetical protein
MSEKRYPIVVDPINVWLTPEQDSSNHSLGMREIFYDLATLGEGIEGLQSPD